MGIWASWFLFWRLAALRTKPTERQESVRSRLSYVVPMLAVIALLSWQRWPGWLGAQVFPGGWNEYWSGVALLLGGLLLAVSARKTLGDNWSGRVSIKNGHELVRSGLYRRIRHPIYTGMLLGFLGTALASARVSALLGFLLGFGILIRKSRMEERFMLAQFGAVYRQYQRTSWALVPLIY